jgi:hypothetical protein
MKLTKEKNPFQNNLKLNNRIYLIVLFIFLILIGLLIGSKEHFGILICVSSLILCTLIYNIFITPTFSIYLLIILSFIIPGIGRYVTAPWGLSIDILIVITYIALFFKFFKDKIPWHKAKSKLTLLVSIWMVYLIFQIINPESKSIEAWFYAVRGVGLYQLLMIPLLLMIFDNNKHLNIFLIIWGILSIFGSLKGIQQFKFGLDPFEQKWLMEVGAKTHILFGKLRIFSFYSDAGQFGASQAHAFVVFGMLALFIKKNIRYFFVVVALGGFIGMFISGTRGAIAVPAMAGVIYLIISKNIKTLILGSGLGIIVYIFFAYTTIGQGNAEIRRMRSAFNPNDASLQVRLDTQKKLKTYLSTRPFGGGVGSTGYWGNRFSPNTFLANSEADSWYVMIWADTGIVGLVYYLFMILFILYVGCYNIMYKIKDKLLKTQITALTCGMSGIILASYGNAVFGQLPTGILMYVSMAFIFISPKLDLIKQNKNTELQ